MTTETVTIPHLGGSTIGYRFGGDYDPDLPTLVMSNSYTTSVDLYRPQFADEQLTSVANLLAIEPYGHGQTRTPVRQFTYWDSAIADLQVLAKLGIAKAFVLGTSQGGWIAARMAILSPEVVRGIIPLGTSMDYESPQSQDRGCWDGIEFCTPAIDMLAEPVGEDWVVAPEFVDAVLDAGLGDSVSADDRAFWQQEYARNYTGDDGRARARLSTINLRDRDGLYGRLDAVQCPVLWLHGTSDTVYSVANAEDGIARFINSPSAILEVIDGGQHFLSASNPEPVNAATAKFIATYAKS